MHTSRPHAFQRLTLQPCAASRCTLERLGAGDLGDVDVGLATPLEVWQSLAAEGFQLMYRRVPLSRERTPEAADLDVLHSQLMLQPEEGALGAFAWPGSRRSP